MTDGGDVVAEDGAIAGVAIAPVEFVVAIHDAAIAAQGLGSVAVEGEVHHGLFGEIIGRAIKGEKSRHRFAPVGDAPKDDKPTVDRFAIGDAG